MMNNASRIGNYKFSQTDKLLLDANIWLYLLPAPSSSSNYATRIYSAAFKGMKDAGCAIFVNALVLSEYLNRYCRLEWQALHRGKYPDFKLFRESSEYCAIGQNAAAFAKAILKNATKESDGFAEADIAAVLSNFELGAADFNDALIIDVCRRRSWTLVTHDRDFTKGGIEVLTDNNKLIVACSHKK